jgi:hypothetical protein
VKPGALSIIAILVLGMGGAAFAQDESKGEDGDLDVTMKLLPEDAVRPDVVTRELELPRDAAGEPQRSEQGAEKSAAGQENAERARENGRSFGQETAAAAQENRENLGRGSRPDGPPGPPPDVPGPPDNPGSPDNPGAPNGPQPPGGPPSTPPGR